MKAKRIITTERKPEVAEYAVNTPVWVTCRSNSKSSPIARFPGIVRRPLISKVLVEYTRSGVTYIEKLLPERLEKRQ